MIIDSMNDRQLALVYAHYLYRNTDLEKYHAQKAVMNMNFYDKIYEIVNEKVKIVKRNQKKLYDISTIDEAKEMLFKMPKSSAEEFIDYFENMHAYSVLPCGTDWDAAEALNMEIPDDLTAFILDGYFRECCEQNKILDNEAMCYINKDVHNRIYTLVCKGSFE